MTRFDTKLAHLGRRSAHRARSVNPPLVRTSTTLFETVDELREAYQSTPYETLRYGIYGTETTLELQRAMAELADAETCIATASGLMSIAATLGAFALPGRRILLQRETYGPTRMLAERDLAQRCEIAYFETEDQLAELIDERTSLVFIEVPTSLTMRLIDVRRVAELAHAHGVMLACDATWGTPLFFDAHGLGVDIAIHAATKYIGGHSDILLGLTTGSRAALETTRAWCQLNGSTAAPDVCWLGLRGLRTLAVRLARHQSSALRIAAWLAERPQVRRVLYPALPSDPQHALWRSLFSGASGLFTIELRDASGEAHDAFVESLQLFGLGSSWGGFESLARPGTSQAQEDAGHVHDDERLVRLHVGLEDPDDLIADLAHALQQL